ncbi:hypothetical protein QO002_000753 [Pararhizobium capsulatum DSM 1112]|uniref:Uncharacterized protein n=1 Tax=Pararhizobium capsulatum DSM 1112 TaxID=1121113 RepID=A0ABU0BK31_9HYPH|nr:hypothetical protein [Pararhizobium capsulatum DSM 1112]
MDNSNPFDPHGVSAANEQRLEAPVEAAETDQPVPAVVVVEQGEIAPWLEVAEVAGPLVSERAAAFLGQLPRQTDDLLVPPKSSILRSRGSIEAKSRAYGLS